MIKAALSVLGAFVVAIATAASVGADNASASSAHTTTPASCVGSAALRAPDGECTSQLSGPTNPTIDGARHDRSNAYPTAKNHYHDCESHSPRFPQVSCGFDAKSSKTAIALVGNSHAAQWLPALQKQADYRGWHVTTFLASSCAFANVRQHWPRAIQTACLTWARTVAQRLAKSSYKLIVISNRISQLAAGTTTTEQSYQPFYAGYWSFLNILHKAHKHVLVIQDTPTPGTVIPDCLQQHLKNYSACNGTRATWVPHDPVMAAARSFKDPNFLEADLTDWLCQPTVCQAVIGGEIVYIDGSHITATYDRSLALPLGSWLVHGLESH